MKNLLCLALCAALAGCATRQMPLETAAPSRLSAREAVLEDSLSAKSARAARLEWRVAELEH